MTILTPRDRLETVFAGGKPDHTPALGGWIAAPGHIAAIAGVTLEQYWADAEAVSLRAYDILGMDGLVGLFVPRHQDDFRCVDHENYMHAKTDMSLEDALDYVDALPSADEILATFAFEERYAAFRQDQIAWQQRCGSMVWMPGQWGAGAKITWYEQLGYENFFLVMGGYPERARKLVEVGGARGHNQFRLVARAVQEGIFPRAVLFGEDICTQKGPMVSPRFMTRCYAPALAHGLEPLLAVGCKPVWHSDGDIRPIMDMLIECGVQGFQGFQPECGLTIDYVASRRTREGNPLLIFGPLAVTTELPVCSPDEIRAKIRHAIDVCRDQADLVIFTANTINPDVPLENVLAMYDEARKPL
jgi:hypothetical protein